MIRMHRVALIAAAACGLMSAQAPILRLTATSDNVAGAPDSIRIDILRWSTDAERDQLLQAWTQPGAPGGGRAGRGGRGGGRAAPLDPAPDPSAVDGNEAPQGAAGRGAGRGGRGAGRGAGRGTEAARVTPEGSLKAALNNAPIVGHLWSSEVAGYSLRSAIKLADPDGGERILLLTDRRLGAWNDLWKFAGSEAAANYEFSVIELHLNSKGEGEGKVSLAGKVAPDAAAKTIALDNYSAVPVVLKNVRRK